MLENQMFQELIELGAQRCALSCDEISDALSSEFFSPDELENLICILPDTDIEVTVPDEEGVSEETIYKDEAGEHENTEDLLQKYFHSMSNISILSRDEETELAQRIEKCRELIKKMVSSMPLFKKFEANLYSRETDEDLIAAEEKRADKALVLSLQRLDSLMAKKTVIRRDQVELETGMTVGGVITQWKKINRLRDHIAKAKDKMIRHNLKLVVHIAKHYVGRGMPLLDLIQEGNIGLMKAIDKFQYQKGFKFSTYATWWIRQAIIRAFIDQGRTIRIPVHFREFCNKVASASRVLRNQLGREPNKEEIAGRLGVSIKKVEEAFMAVSKTVSLQAPLGDNGAETGDFIADGSSPSPYEVTEKNDITERVLAILGTLTPREEKTIRMRFGIGVDRDYTLEEIGRLFSVTRERVRQIETSALRKLRHPSRLRELRRLTGEAPARVIKSVF